MRARLLALLIALAFASVACGKDKKKVAKPTSSGTVTSSKAPLPEKGGLQEPAGVDPASLKNVIYFEFDKSELSEESRQILANNAEWLKQDSVRKLTIEGHTDEVGTPEYNLGLGERRAHAARDYLIALGVGEDRVQIITYGEEKPASEEDSLNRRSMFIATKQN
jgi:peptidoglycan-associated lipoprotein